MEERKLSKNQLRRLPDYLNLLKNLSSNGVKFISCKMIADCLNLNNEQVRKDIAMVSKEDGIPNKGREIFSLIKDIEVNLGYDNTHNAVLVGVGSLGKALMNYDGFKEYGLKIIGAFDPSREYAGKSLNGIKIYDSRKMSETLPALDAHIGIICVPASVAQDIANQLIAGGIEAIWNFAPANLSLPKDIIISNMNMATSLAVLSHELYLKKKREEEKHGN
jgi:redox-sensing transcriptional repressor